MPAGASPDAEDARAAGARASGESSTRRRRSRIASVMGAGSYGRCTSAAEAAAGGAIDGCTAGDIAGDTERAVGTAATWPVLRLAALEVGLSASVERST